MLVEFRMCPGPLIIVAAVLRHKLFGDFRDLIVLILLVEIRKRFAEIFNLEVWRDGPEIEGMDLY